MFLLPTETPPGPCLSLSPLGVGAKGRATRHPLTLSLPFFLFVAEDGEGTGGPNLKPPSPYPRLGIFFQGSRGTGSKIVLCKFQYLYAGAAVRMNARNNYQIMHVELVFLHPEPLKGKAKT